MALLIHVTFSVSGERARLAAFDARLKELLAEHQTTGEIQEQHTADTLHYDLKVEGGIPFPPFALASGEFPDLAIEVEWVDPGTGARGTARIVGGTLAEQNIDNVAAAAADYAVAVTFKDNGCLVLALAAVRTGRDEYRGYALTGRQDALFRIVRDPSSGRIELFTTQGAAEWSRIWRVPPDGAPEYQVLDPAPPIPDGEFRELEKLARDFAAAWIWFCTGPREEIAVEMERYQRMGYVVSDANLRSSALHRIKGGAAEGGVQHHSTLAADAAWIEDVVARCWPGDE
jgi:hypothetical protein